MDTLNKEEKDVPHIVYKLQVKFKILEHLVQVSLNLVHILKVIIKYTLVAIINPFKY